MPTETVDPAATRNPRPIECAARIAEVQRRWIALRRLHAVSRLIASVSLVLVIAVVIDANWRGGHGARAIILLASMTAIALFVRRYVIPLWPPLSRDAAAMGLERTYPDLKGALVTAVQLAEVEKQARFGTSMSLYNHVCISVEARARDIQAARVLPGRQTLKSVAALWGVVILVALLAGMNAQAASTGMTRLLIPWSDAAWPQRTRVIMTNPATGHTVHVVRGGTLSLAGRVEGDIPTTGTLRVQIGSAGADRAYFDIEPAGRFVVRYRPVNTDLDIAVEIGDAPPLQFNIVMIPPPEITAIEAECVYPTYTNLPPQRYADGNIQAVFGSEIRLRVTSSKPLARATLAWADDETPITMHTTGEPECSATFTVNQSRSYRIHLVDQEQCENADPVIYHVEMIDNQYPQLTDVTPTADKRVTPAAVLPITARVTDDFGITDVILSYRVDTNEEVSQIAIPLNRPGKRLEIRHDWSLDALKLQADQTVTYRIEVRDAGPHATQRDWPVSQWRRLNVMTEPELARLLIEQLEQIMDQLAQTSDLQNECADTVQQIAVSVTGESGPRKTAQERTQSEKWRQDWLARRAGQLANRLAGLADDYEISRIGQASRRKRLRETADRLARLAGADMPGAVLALQEALSTLRGESPPATRPQETP